MVVVLCVIMIFWRFKGLLVEDLFVFFFIFSGLGLMKVIWGRFLCFFCVEIRLDMV